MNKNPITLNEIEQVIDNAIDDNKSFFFACDAILASYIEEYLFEEFGIENECEETDVSEYYVSSLPSYNDEPYRLFIESAKGNSGKYKMSDLDGCSYYIFLDMPLRDAQNNLFGEKFGYFELVDEDDIEDEDCDGDCIECKVNKYAELLQENCCPTCTKNILLSYLDEVLDKIESEDDED